MESTANDVSMTANDVSMTANDVSMTSAGGIADISPVDVHLSDDNKNKPLADEVSTPPTFNNTPADAAPVVYHNDNVADVTADDIASLLDISAVEDDSVTYLSATDLYIASLQEPSTYAKYQPTTAYGTAGATVHWSTPSSVALTGARSVNSRYDTRYNSSYDSRYNEACADDYSAADDATREDIADLMASVADLQSVTDKIAIAIDGVSARLTSLEHSQRIVVEHLAQLVASLSALERSPSTFESHDSVE